jgi:hypothetical protein
MIEDWETPFIPEDTIKIDSNGGNIGRFYWSNQVTFSIEQWGHNNFYEATVYELPGISAFLWSEFDWVGWLMGGFEPSPKTNSRPTHYSRG